MSALQGFSVQMHGFAFPNAFPSVPLETITVPFVGQMGRGNASNGLCGGMAFAAADLFHAKNDASSHASPPPERSVSFRYLVKRLIDSFALPSGPEMYYTWMRTPNLDVQTRTEAPRVMAALDRNEPAPLGLIRMYSTRLTDLGSNHQVLAYGYALDGTQLTVD